MKTLSKTTLSLTAIAAVGFFMLPPTAEAQSRFSKFRVQQTKDSSGNSSNSSSRFKKTSSSSSNSKKRYPSKPTISISKSPTLQVRPAVQPKPSYQTTVEKKPTLQVRPSSNPAPSVRPSYQTRPSTPSKPSISIATKPKTPYVPSRPAVTRPSSPSKPVVTIPSRPSTPSRPANNGVADVSKMISILQGTRGTAKPSTTSIASKKVTSDASRRPSISTAPKVTPGAPVLDRVVKVNPKALPKGMGTTTFMKKGNTPAVGLPENPGTVGSVTIQRMKKGNDRAEGEATRGAPISVRIKEGRPQAESSPQPSYGNEGIAQNLSSGGGASSSPSSSGPSGYEDSPSIGYPAAPSISYKVDSTSQLSTDSVKFRKGSTELADAASYHYLQNLAAALRDPSLASERFVVEGHASAEGAETSNLILSQQRSNAIFDFMISQGISSDRLLSIGHGEFHARYTTSHPEYLRAQDRQVIVFKLAE